MVEYDKRKVIRVGEKSYAVTLPKKWCAELGIKPGDIVNLVRHEGGIVLKVRDIKPVEDAQIFLDASRGDEQFVIQLISCYIEGATRIKVKGDPKKLSKLLQLLSRRLMGLVAMGDFRSMYTDIVILSANVDVRDVINRVASAITEAFNAIFSYIKTGDRRLLGDTLRLCDEVYRLYFLGLRLAKSEMLRTSGEESLALADLIIFLRDVESIADSLTRLVRSLSSLDRESLPKLEEAFILVKKVALDSINAFSNDKIEMALNLLSNSDKLKKVLASVQADGAEGTIVNELSAIASASTSIAEIVLGRCVRNKMCRCKYFYPKL